MKKVLRKNHLFLLAIFLVTAPSLFSQVTTATLSGIVKDAAGAVLPSATVKVEYPDAGISQTLVTRSDGRFTVPNLRVGGPYRITVNHVSYQQAVSENIFLELGLNNTVEFKLEQKSTEIGGVTVVSRFSARTDARTSACQDHKHIPYDNSGIATVRILPGRQGRRYDWTKKYDPD